MDEYTKNQPIGSTISDDSIEYVNIEPIGIMQSKWCVKCYPKKVGATFIFQGSSLCEECFKRYALL